MKHYLSACAIYRDEAPYLREWIEFHRLVGVERFYLYDNRSTDGHLSELAPYLDGGPVTLTEWPLEPGQPAAFEHCLNAHRGESRWIAFLDLDEFLFSPAHRPLPEILRDFEEFPAVGVNWALFGTGGHVTRPDALVIESYTRRAADDYVGAIKSVVDPERTIRCAGGVNPHAFAYTEGVAVNERKRPIDRQPFGRSTPVSYSLLRVNHYWLKSKEQWLAKMARPTSHTGRPGGIRPEAFDRIDASCSAVPDEAILHYLPDLKRALAV